MAKKSRVRRFLVLFFVAAWMFILGVLVGRGTSPLHFDMKKLEKELASLKELVSMKERAKFKIDSPSSEPSKELKFYDALKAPEKEEKQPPPEAKVQQAQKPKPSRKGEHDKDKVVSGSEVAKTRPIESTSVQEEKKTAARPDERARRLTIQVAAVKDARTAAKEVDQLRVKGYPAYQEVVTLKQKGTWYRIRIGSFVDAADAQNTLQRLRKDKYEPIIVRME